MTSGLLPLSASLYPLCRSFLLAREYCCVPLVAAFLESRQKKPEYQSNTFVVLVSCTGTNTPRIEGVLHRTPGGTVLHLLEPAALSETYREQLAQWLNERSLYCILGTAAENRFLESLIPRPSKREVDYELMTLAQEPTAEAATLPLIEDPVSGRKSAPRVRRIHPGDAEFLLPLQIGYEQEEVLAPGNQPNRDHTLFSFRTALSRQDVYAAFYGKHAVAKAGTNARGFKWDQLGGIYTAPDFRCKGIASALVAHVVLCRIREGKNSVLFVKTGNMSAKKAYQRVGFTPQEDFRIVYF